ncbi:MAG: dihydroorotate dehydrogenase electron transfer subunit [Lachnospiraceae bacterium]|nr:dihydroorotate dehydrogenase electron transfer subunit [Lachnospiraceae bacterium]
MKDSIFTVISNINLTELVLEMRLRGDTSAITNPGQFVNLKLPEFYLRRPISVADVTGDVLTIAYKVVGKGTASMAEIAAGTRLDILTGLGNGYDLTKAGEKPLLIGGGVGVPPLLWLAKKLREQEIPVDVVLGFNTASEVFYQECFEALGCRVEVTTADGSLGTKGFVTDAALFSEAHSYFYTCGPLPMLRAVYNGTDIDGEFSFEERMGCGFGACMGCSQKVRGGSKRICKDGPVLRKEEILWEN